MLGVQLADLQTEPANLFDGRQLYFSCESDENELTHVFDVIGADWIVFAPDYSHFDSRSPGLPI